MEINSAGMLTRMKIDAMKASGVQEDIKENDGVRGFQESLKDAVENVIEAQDSSKMMSNEFSIGNPNVSLIDAKIASEVAEVKTQILIATTQKVLKAYRDISNMSI